MITKFQKEVTKDLLVSIVLYFHPILDKDLIYKSIKHSSKYCWKIIGLR